jgi:hypothetical protein
VAPRERSFQQNVEHAACLSRAVRATRHPESLHIKTFACNRYLKTPLRDPLAPRRLRGHRSSTSSAMPPASERRVHRGIGLHHGGAHAQTGLHQPKLRSDIVRR